MVNDPRAQGVSLRRAEDVSLILADLPAREASLLRPTEVEAEPKDVAAADPVPSLLTPEEGPNRLVAVAIHPSLALRSQMDTSFRVQEMRTVLRLEARIVQAASSALAVLEALTGTIQVATEAGIAKLRRTHFHPPI